MRCADRAVPATHSAAEARCFRQRGGARRLAAIVEARDHALRTGFFKQDRCALAAIEQHVNEDIGSIAGREHDAAIAREERLGRLAVDRHHARCVTLDPQHQSAGNGRVDEAQPQPLIGAHRKRHLRRPIDGQRRRGGVRPILEHEQHVAIDRDRCALLDDQGAAQPAPDLRCRVARRVIPESSGVGRAEAIVEARCPARSAVWVRSGTPSMALGARTPCQCSAVGSGRSLTSRPAAPHRA